MNEATFQTLARRARLLTSDYGAGYLTGLRRHYHGESFGNPQELAALAAAGLNGDPRVELGRGYRDGLAGVEPQPLTGRPPLPAGFRHRSGQITRAFSSWMFMPRPLISLHNTSKETGVPASSVLVPLTMDS